MSFYSPLPEPIPLKEQSWPEGTRPLLCTSTFCFQHETYVRQCIESILMQRTTFPVRVCIHDDASTDKTAEVIRSYQEAYPGKIWAFFQPENTFLHPDRIQLQREYRAWTEAGRYIAMCEGDDYWMDPLKLQKQVELLETHPGINLCVHDVEVSHEGIPLTREQFYNVPFDGDFRFTYEDYFSNHFFHTASKVFRVPADLEFYHEVIGRVRAGDLVSNHLFLASGDGYYIAEKMAFKRRNQGGYTKSALYQDSGKRRLDWYNVWKEIERFAPKRMKQNVWHMLADIERQFVKSMFQKRRFGSALKYGLLAVAHHPSWFIGKISALTGSNKL